MSKVFISCDEARILGTRNQYGDLTAKEKFRYNFHISYCLPCRNIDRKNRKFTGIIKRTDWARLSTAQKDLMKKRLRENLN